VANNGRAGHAAVAGDVDALPVGCSQGYPALRGVAEGAGCVGRARSVMAKQVAGVGHFTSLIRSRGEAVGHDHVCLALSFEVVEHGEL
jgi:hypothetical protein